MMCSMEVACLPNRLWDGEKINNTHRNSLSIHLSLIWLFNQTVANSWKTFRDERVSRFSLVCYSCVSLSPDILSLSLCLVTDSIVSPCEKRMFEKAAEMDGSSGKISLHLLMFCGRRRPRKEKSPPKSCSSLLLFYPSPPLESHENHTYGRKKRSCEYFVSR